LEEKVNIEQWAKGYGISYECLKEFSERMKNLAPFIHLIKKLTSLQKYEEYDMVSIGFGVMLFILENMLIGREECDIDEIAGFLQEVIYHSYSRHITQDEAKEMAFYIRDSIAGSGGEVFPYPYKDLETGMDDTVPVKLIDTSYYEIKKTAKYKLTDQGMELLFKTREIYSEFRINVTQLYLKQQIEKGVFTGALQTVNELNLQVRQLRERLEALVLNIRQNVLGVDFEELKKLFARIQEQFKIERKEFANIKRILNVQRDNIEKISYEDLSEKELRDLSNISNLYERLNITVSEHDMLFKEKLDIIGEYLRMLEFRLKQGISEFIDFEKSIFDVIMSKDLKVDVLHSILSPIIVNMGKYKQFNIMKAVDYQRVRTEEEEEQVYIDLEEEMEQREKEIKEQVEKRNNKIEYYFEKILEEVYQVYNQRNKDTVVETTLEAVLERFDDDAYNRASSDFDFYSLVMMLHQNKELDIVEILEIGTKLVSDNTYNINLEFLLSRIIEKNIHYKEIKKLALISPNGSSNRLYTFKNDNVITNFIVRGEF
jgi:hypothetical protein